MTWNEWKQKNERAMMALQDRKNHEAEYAVINQYQLAINQLDALSRMCEMMAEDLGKAQGAAKEEVLEKYCEKI